MNKNNYSQVYQEFNQRYKYCYELLEEYYKNAETSDIKPDIYYYKQWTELSFTIDKIIQQLNLCSHDAQYLATFYKEKELIQANLKL